MSLLQIQARDQQDIHLQSDDLMENSLFVTKYKRHSHFALEHREAIFDKNVHDDQSRIVVTIPRVGDLVTNLCLTAQMTRSQVITDLDDFLYPLETVIDRVQLMVGGVVIEEHHGLYFRLYDEVFRGNDQRLSYKVMSNFDHNDPPGTTRTLYLPLNFTCCNPSTPLPLLSLAYAEVDVVIFTKDTPAAGVEDHIIFSVDCEYVYLLPEDRKDLLQPKEYLIKQVQHQEFPLSPDMFTSNYYSFNLSFNHPVFKIFIAASHKDSPGAFTGSGVKFEDAEAYAPIESMKVVVNGHEMMTEKAGSFYRQANMFTSGLLPSAGVYVLDFAVNDLFPSGSLNFSKLDSVVLHVKFKRDVEDTTVDDKEGIGLKKLTALHVLALNYNMMRVADGQAGILYAN